MVAWTASPRNSNGSCPPFNVHVDVALRGVSHERIFFPILPHFLNPKISNLTEPQIFQKSEQAVACRVKFFLENMKTNALV